MHFYQISRDWVYASESAGCIMKVAELILYVNLLQYSIYSITKMIEVDDLTIIVCNHQISMVIIGLNWIESYTSIVPYGGFIQYIDTLTIPIYIFITHLHFIILIHHRYDGDIISSLILAYHYFNVAICLMNPSMNLFSL